MRRVVVLLGRAVGQLQRAPASFWSTTVGSAGEKLGDKWLVVDSSQAGGGSGLTLQSLASSLDVKDSPLQPHTTTSTVDGAPAVVVSQQDGSTLAVASTGTPYPLQIVNKTSAAAGTVTFSDYGRTISIAAPQGALTPQQAAGGTGAG